MPVSRFLQNFTPGAVLAAQGVPSFTGVSLQTSAQAIPISQLWGSRRVTPNLIWQTPFEPNNISASAGRVDPHATPLDASDIGGRGWTWTHLSTTSFAPITFMQAPGAWQGAVDIFGGAHGGVEYGSPDPSSSAYTWWVPMIMALCEGPITSVTKVFNPGGTAPVSFAFPNLYSASLNPPCLFYEVKFGTSSQSVWDFFSAANLTTGGPWYTQGEDLTYRFTAYIASAVFDCGHDLRPPQQSFEVVRTPNNAYRLLDSYTLAYDYSLADIIPDFLTNPTYGMGLSSGDIDSATLLTFKQYQFAQGLYFSPLLTSQTAATSILDRWAIEANTWIYFSGTAIMFAPLGDEAITANGQTYTPDATPAYNLGPNDFVDHLLQVNRADPIDCNNRVRIEFTDRFNNYAKSPIEWKDTTLINQFGLRDASNINGEDICDIAVAAKVVELYGKRMAYIRNTYTFSLHYRYIRILPGTIVTLTDANLGLNLVPVRIRTIEEDEKGNLAVVAEEYPGTLGLSRPQTTQVWTQQGLAGSAPGGSSSGPSGGTAIPPPGPPISTPTTVGAPAIMFLIQAVAGGYTITLGTITPGVVYRWKHVGGAAGTNLFESGGGPGFQYVTLSRGSNTFTIEDPQDPILTAAANSVTFRTSGVTYAYMLDSTNNVFRSLGLS